MATHHMPLRGLRFVGGAVLKQIPSHTAKQMMAMNEWRPSYRMIYGSSSALDACNISYSAATLTAFVE